MPSTESMKTDVPELLMDVRLFIATPAYAGLITTGYLQSLLASKSRLEALGATVVVETISNESLIARARNACVARFMAAGIEGQRFTHLMFIDADVSFPADAIERLLLSGEPVTAGCYPLKGVDWERLVELARQGQLREMSARDAEAASLHYALNCNLPEHLEGAFMPVLDVGAGFLCLTRGAVETLIEVYGDQTRYLNNVAGYELPGPGYEFAEELRFYNLFESHIDPDTHLYLSEDYAFCRRWRESGGIIWLDLSTDLTHIGTHFYRGSIGRFLESLKGVPFEGESD